MPTGPEPACPKCHGTGWIPDPDRGSGNGPYWDDPCDCGAQLEPRGGFMAAAEFRRLEELPPMNRAYQIADILEAVEFRDWHFSVSTNPSLTGDIHSLAVIFTAPDSETSQPALQRGREWLVSPWMNRDQIVQTALLAVLTAVEHEAREEFHYKGQPVFGPHQRVDELHSLAAM